MSGTARRPGVGPGPAAGGRPPRRARRVAVPLVLALLAAMGTAAADPASSAPPPAGVTGALLPRKPAPSPQAANGLLPRKPAPPATAPPPRKPAPHAATAGASLAGKPPPRSAPRTPEPRPGSQRVVVSSHPGALFAQHSWYVLPPAPLPPPPPPPPPPTAPLLPYAFVGSYAHQGEQPVYFLSRGDRVVDAHVGDRLDGVYQLESAAEGQLVFVYLPLNVRQNLATGASR